MSSNKNLVIDATIGPRLLELCGTRGLSFSELSRRTEINRSTLTRMLKGQRPVQAAELTRLLKVLRVRRRDFLPQLAVGGPPTPEPTTARPESVPVDIQALEDQLRLAIDQRDDLADQVERLCAELRVERAERVNELAEVRDRHLREVVDLRNQFLAELTKALDEAADAVARDEKAKAALGVVLAELTRRDRAEAEQGSRGGRTARSTSETTTDSASSDSRSWVETAAGIAAGLGGLALGTWLLTSKRAERG
jgi:transcriptional regulator with XRE-family HTH domain